MKVSSVIVAVAQLLAVANTLPTENAGVHAIKRSGGALEHRDLLIARNLLDRKDEDDTWSNKADEKRNLLEIEDEDDNWSNKAGEKRNLLDRKDEDDTWSNKADE